jgi:hypothetical protein
LNYIVLRCVKLEAVREERGKSAGRAREERGKSAGWQDVRVQRVRTGGVSERGVGCRRTATGLEDDEQVIALTKWRQLAAMTFCPV